MHIKQGDCKLVPNSVAAPEKPQVDLSEAFMITHNDCFINGTRWHRDSTRAG